MIMVLQLTKQNSLTDAVSAWITSGTTKLTWLKSCLGYMVSMQMDDDSKPGASTVRQRGLTSTRCDIFATLSSYYSGDLTQRIFFIFIFFKNQAVTVNFEVTV